MTRRSQRHARAQVADMLVLDQGAAPFAIVIIPIHSMVWDGRVDASGRLEGDKLKTPAIRRWRLGQVLSRRRIETLKDEAACSCKSLSINRNTWPSFLG